MNPLLKRSDMVRDSYGIICTHVQIESCWVTAKVTGADVVYTSIGCINESSAVMFNGPLKLLNDQTHVVETADRCNM